MEKELSQARTELVRLRVQTTMLAERVEALEKVEDARMTAARRDEARVSEVAEGTTARVQTSSDRPQLAVVRLVPDAAAGRNSPEESSPRDDGLQDPEDDGAPRIVLRSAAGGAVKVDNTTPRAAPSSSAERRK